MTEYVHTKPRSGKPGHIFEHPPSKITWAYTDEVTLSVCGVPSRGRFYKGLPDDLEDNEVCGNCRRVIRAREMDTDAVSAHEED